MILVKDLLNTLDCITKGRCVKSSADYSTNNFIITKSSNIPGKAVTELPGLIYGDPNMEIRKIAIIMTLTESAIELAAASNVDAIIAHHPIADACNSGGLLLKDYLGLYNIAVFELHEAFHGLHPGIPYLHGHNVIYSNLNYGDIPGNVVYIGETYEEIKTLGDILSRLDSFINNNSKNDFAQNKIKTSLSLKGEILLGNTNTPVNKLIHIFPHTGFSTKHLEQLLKDFPDVDTLLATVSRVYPPHPLIDKAKEFNLNFICGNSHTVEILENGIPLAYAIKSLLPEVEIVLFREIMESIPLDLVGNKEMRNYGKFIAKNYLT